ncbi:MAG: aminotransferase class III-fold pyridoxal phosphate-dependent enzyme [Thermoleophilia bacterium]
MNAFRKFEDSSVCSNLLVEGLNDHSWIALGRSGSKITISNNTVLDLTGGSHSCCVLDDDGKIMENVKSRLDEVYPFNSRHFVHPIQQELAEHIARVSEDDQSRVYFTSGGTEALEIVLQLASYVQSLRGKTNCDVVIGRNNSYHGMSILARNVAGHPVHSQLSPEINYYWPKLPEPRCSSCSLKLKPPDCNLGCARELENILTLIDHDRIVALVIEPIGGTTSGAVVPPPGYLDLLARICHREGILLVVDEVVTAFWRTGQAFASLNAQPDFIMGGKCLAAGLAPLGCVIVSGEVCKELGKYDARIPLRLTFSGNPLACLVGLSVQNHIRNARLDETVLHNSDMIRLHLERECVHDSQRESINGIGHLWSVEKQVETGRGAAEYSKITKEAFDKHIAIMGGWRSGMNHDYVHLMFTPAFDVKQKELSSMIDKLGTLVRKIS